MSAAMSGVMETTKTSVVDYVALRGLSRMGDHARMMSRELAALPGYAPDSPWGSNLRSVADASMRADAQAIVAGLVTFLSTVAGQS